MLEPYNPGGVPRRQNADDVIFYHFCIPRKYSEPYLSDLASKLTQTDAGYHFSDTSLKLYMYSCRLNSVKVLNYLQTLNLIP